MILGRQNSLARKIFYRKRLLISAVCALVGVAVLVGTTANKIRLNKMVATPPSPPPIAKPVVVDYRIESAIIADNTLNITVRNDGQAGWVAIGYDTWWRPDPIMLPHQRSWSVYTWLDKGETKQLGFALPCHSIHDEQGRPTVLGVNKPMKGGVIK